MIFVGRDPVIHKTEAPDILDLYSSIDHTQLLGDEVSDGQAEFYQGIVGKQHTSAEAETRTQWDYNRNNEYDDEGMPMDILDCMR